MKVKGFGARPSSNVFSGGQRTLDDPFNKSFKGDAFNTEFKKKNYPEATSGYMSCGVKEYNRYPEMKDMTAGNDEQHNAAAAAGDALLSKTRKSRMRVMQQVVALLVGSVIITTSYQAMASKRQEPQNQYDSAAVDVTDNTDATDPQDSTSAAETEPTVETVVPTDATEETTPGGVYSEQPDATEQSNSVSWQWSEDGNSATLIVKDSSGNVISKIQADITTATDEATCKKSGTKTYTATAEFNGQTYTDARDEVIPALGHSFDDGTEVTLDDGSPAMDFECKRCHEHFVIKNSTVEE